jgi:hypothetical protein
MVESQLGMSESQIKRISGCRRFSEQSCNPLIPSISDSDKQSHGYYNYFGPMKAAPHCEDADQGFIDNTLQAYGLQRCHIVDFSLNPTVWSEPNFCPNLFCGNCVPPNLPPATNPHTLDKSFDCAPGAGQDIWDNNTYDEPCQNVTPPYK